MKFKKATKQKQKLRLLLSAPSGSGKTYSALRIATGISSQIGSRIALIDTEKGSASLYSDKFDFDVLELKEPTLDNYIAAIKEAELAEYKVLIIDSSSHGWQQLLDYVEKLTTTKYKGNQFRAWGEGTPLYNKWINAMLDFNGHIIVTARAKTEYVQEFQNGKTAVKKVGVGTENRKGLEYEFTIAADGDTDGNWCFTKSRVSELAQKIINNPSEQLGIDLYNWLTVVGIDAVTTDPVKKEFIENLIMETDADVVKFRNFYNIDNFEELSDELADTLIRVLTAKHEKMCDAK
ncbi:MAG: ATP-binding protein [Cetobacterium sp.]